MKKILLAEDDSFIVDIYSSYLKKAGYNVDVALNGSSAIEKIKKDPPDLLILDIIMPGMDGWEVLKELRGNPDTKDLKVIVISNLDLADHAQDLSNYKVSKTFLKIGTTLDEITKSIGELLK